MENMTLQKLATKIDEAISESGAGAGIAVMHDLVEEYGLKVANAAFDEYNAVEGF